MTQGCDWATIRGVILTIVYLMYGWYMHHWLVDRHPRSKHGTIFVHTAQCQRRREVRRLHLRHVSTVLLSVRRLIPNGDLTPVRNLAKSDTRNSWLGRLHYQVLGHLVSFHTHSFLPSLAIFFNDGACWWKDIASSVSFKWRCLRDARVLLFLYIVSPLSFLHLIF